MSARALRYSTAAATSLLLAALLLALVAKGAPGDRSLVAWNGGGGPGTIWSPNPPAYTNDPNIDFSFSPTGMSDGAECAFNGGLFSACSSPWMPGLSGGDGSYDVEVRSCQGGTCGGQLLHTITLDTMVPNSQFTDGITNTNDNTPTLTFVDVDAGTDVTWDCVLDGAAPLTCSDDFTPAALLDGVHTFTVRGTDQANNVEPAPVAHVPFRVDVVVPNTTWTAPAAVTNDTTPTFSFVDNSAAGSAVTFECEVLNSSLTTVHYLAGCTSSYTPTALPGDGTYTVQVRGSDLAGNQEAQEQHGFVLDTTAPASAWAGGSATNTNDDTPSFSFTDTAVGGTAVTFRCRVLGLQVEAGCSSPYTPTALTPDGVYTIDVTATDLAGNAETPVTHQFRLDRVAPDTQLVPPPALTNDNTPSFSFSDGSAAGSPVTFQCQVDLVTVPCTSPFTTAALGDGSHNLIISAVDAAGNTESMAPASHSFTVDTTPPDTTITSGPTGDVTSTDASFSFSATPAGGTFQCQLDTGGFTACTSPRELSSLPLGAHTFTVRAIDAAGNADPSPGTRTWTVVAPPQPPAPPAPPTPPADTTPPVLSVGKLTVNRKRTILTVPVLFGGEPAGTTCTATVVASTQVAGSVLRSTLRAKKVTVPLGSGTAAGDCGKPVKVAIKLSKKGKAVFGKLKQAKVKLTITGTDLSGNRLVLQRVPQFRG